MEQTAARPQERRFRGHTLATVTKQDSSDNEIFVTQIHNGKIEKTPTYYRVPDESWKERLRGIPDVQAVPYSVRRASESLGSECSSDE